MDMTSGAAVEVGGRLRRRLLGHQHVAGRLRSHVTITNLLVTSSPPRNACVTTKVGHGYGKTRGFWVTGVTGTGTGLAFGNPRHTVYPYRGVTGFQGYIILG